MSKNLPPDAKQGLKHLPLDFLEAYPFPAFALHVPIPLDELQEQYSNITETNQTPGEERTETTIDAEYGRQGNVGSSSIKDLGIGGGTRSDVLKEVESDTSKEGGEGLLGQARGGTSAQDAFGGVISATSGGTVRPTIVSTDLTDREQSDVKTKSKGQPNPPTSSTTKQTFQYNPFLRTLNNSINHPYNAGFGMGSGSGISTRDRERNRDKERERDRENDESKAPSIGLAITDIPFIRKHPVGPQSDNKSSTSHQDQDQVVSTSSSSSHKNNEKNTHHALNNPNPKEPNPHPHEYYTSSLNPIWSNDKWSKIIKGKSLLDCLNVTEARKFGNWVSGLMEWEMRKSSRDERWRVRREKRRLEKEGLGIPGLRRRGSSDQYAESGSGSGRGSGSGSGSGGAGYGQGSTTEWRHSEGGTGVGGSRMGEEMDLTQSQTWKRRQERGGGKEESSITGIRRPDTMLGFEMTRGASDSPSSPSRSSHPVANDHDSFSAESENEDDDDDSTFLTDLLDQPTLLLNLKDPDITFECVKTAFPQEPASLSLSYLVVQMIPRRYRIGREEMEGKVGMARADREEGGGKSRAERERVGIEDKERENARSHSEAGKDTAKSFYEQDVSPLTVPTLSASGFGSRSSSRAWPFDRSKTVVPESFSTSMTVKSDGMLSPISKTPVAEREEPSYRDIDGVRKLPPMDDPTMTKLFTAKGPLILGDTSILNEFTSRVNRAEAPVKVETLLRSTDWNNHTLGPIHLWPPSIRTALSLVLNMPGQACLWAGKELVMLYNDFYADMIGRKHPSMFGQMGAVGYAEVWRSLGPLAEQALAGQTLMKDDDLFLFETRDEKVPLEEFWHSWMWVPLRDERGEICGLFNYTRECTQATIAERRTKCARETNDLLSAARNMGEFNSAVEEGFSDENIAKDIPFAILYHVSPDEARGDITKATSLLDDRSAASGKQQYTRLKLDISAKIGIPTGHSSAPDEVSITIKKQARTMGGLNPNRTSSPTMSMISALSQPLDEDVVKTGQADFWPFQEALQSRKIVIVEDVSNLIKGFPVRSWDTAPRSAAVIPIFNESSSDAPCLVMVIGLSPVRPYDHLYSEWLHSLRMQLYSGLLQVRSVEAELRRSAELQQMDQMKTNWLQNTSHEVRLPLSLIKGPIEDLIPEFPQGSRQQNMLVIARRNVNRLQRLIDSLMDYSRLEAGRLVGSFRAVGIGAFTRDLAELFRPAMEKAKLEYIVDCEDDRGRVCYLDPDLYEKISLNIIGNAFKYTHSGFIKVELRYQPDSVRFAVSDSGVGIPAAQLPMVTERFFRVSTTGRTHEGTGIGLSLTKELVRLHHGTLSVESSIEEERPDKPHGSTFSVSLPLGSGHLANIDDDDVEGSRQGTYAYSKGVIDEAMQWNRDQEAGDSSSDSGASSNMLTGNSGASLDPNTLFFTKDDTILVVDDSRDLRTYLVAILKPYVGNIAEAGTGAEGLAKAKALRPQLIISDVQMPGEIDGFGLLHGIKKSEDDLRFTPVIMLTARAGEGDRVEGLLSGAEDWMSKPFNSKELVARASLQVQLGKRRRILEEAFSQRLDEVEKRREEAEMERKRQELLIDVTSHELRNPTSAIIQCSQMVMQNLGTLRLSLDHAIKEGKPFPITAGLLEEMDADVDLLQNIFNCANAQNNIANDVLSLARISMDMLTFSEAPTEVAAKAKEVCAMFALEAKSKDIDLRLEMSPSMSQLPIVETDPVRLGQVLVNLTSNALRWTTDRPIRKVTLKFSLASTPPFDDSCAFPTNSPLSPDMVDGEIAYLYTEVHDTGPGLSREDVEKLFQRFSQASQKGNKVFGGSGLGLYVCRKITEQMGGRIEVVSNFGQGACFRFFIRVRAANLGSRIPHPPSLAGRRRSSLEREHKAHILVVEDNMINQKVLLRQLRKSGLTCEAANNGLEAVRRIRQVCSTTSPIDKPFDCVLLDLEMPIMGGLEAIRIIRSEEQQGLLKRSLVFALTGNARQAQIEEAMAMGMDSVIIKPYKIDDVLDKISDAVEGTLATPTALSEAMRRSITAPIPERKQV